MAQALQFQYGGAEFACGISKVDRTKLYGSVEQEVLDEQGRPCTLATLAGDGKTIIPAGGTAFANISPDGLWCERDDLRPVDLDGNEIEPVQSSFKVTTELSARASYEDYLSHNIRLCYLLDPVDGEIPQPLVEELRKGAIYRFEFSYRGGLEHDAAFLLAGPDGAIWMMVGKPTKIHFIGYEQAGAAGGEGDLEEDADADELMDFGF